MRKITLWLFSTVAAVVLLFSYRTSAPPAPVSLPAADPLPTADGETFSGATVPTEEGDVQVVITVADGKIVAVAVPVKPGGSPRHEEVSARAVPQLVEATLAAQSADIDSVSGATYTSGGYKESLQSALDAAQLS